MHTKTAVAVAALAASGANALSAHRHKHVQREAAAERLARANQERALLEERALVYKHTTTELTTEWYTVYVTVDGDEEPAVAPTAAFFETFSSAEAEPTPDPVPVVEEPAVEEPTVVQEAPEPTAVADTPAEPVVVEEPATTAAPVQVEPEPTTAAPVVEEPEPTTAAAPVVSVPVSSGGKRGVAYNDVSLGQQFASANSISWGYNWGSDGSLDGAEYVPMCWGPKFDFVGVWPANAQRAIDNGATALLSMNEPDLPGQAFDVLDKDSTGTINSAVSLHKQIMTPFVGKARIGSPAVTSNYPATGRSCQFTQDPSCLDQPVTDYYNLRSYSWLKEFLSVCGGDCPVDFLNVHYYSGGDCNGQLIGDFIQDVSAALPGYPIWVTELGTADGCSEAQQASFLSDALAFLESSPLVERYSYFFADGALSTGSQINSLGNMYTSI